MSILPAIQLGEAMFGREGVRQILFGQSTSTKETPSDKTKSPPPTEHKKEKYLKTLTEEIEKLDRLRKDKKVLKRLIRDLQQIKKRLKKEV